MGKPLVGDVVVLPFPQTNLQAGKRRPALVVAELKGDDVILCQITGQNRSDGYSVSLHLEDFESGRLAADSFARANRLFTVDQSVILYTACRLKLAKINEVDPEFGHYLLEDSSLCPQFISQLFKRQGIDHILLRQPAFSRNACAQTQKTCMFETMTVTIDHTFHAF